MARSTRYGLALALLAGLLLALPASADERIGPFTQPQRSVRSRKIDQQHIRLELKFFCDDQRFEGRALHRLALLAPASTIELDAAEMQISKVTLLAESNEAVSELKFQHQGASLRIELGKEFAIGETLRLAIDYQVTKPKNGVHFVLPDPAEPRAGKMLWTQGEPEYARFWFPCFDSPTDRLTSEILATVPKDWQTLSNGVLSSRVENADGTATFHWTQAHSHVSYLMSIVAGEFEIYEQAWDGIPVQSYVPKGRLADAPRSFDKTAEMVKYFSEKIGYRYPWPKYAQICVDEYNWGGMENTSATTLNLGTLHDERAHDDFSSVNLVAHELAHQWWGDLLTCKDWGELWLNESFATYFATLWTEHDEGWDEAAWDRWNEAETYFGEDANYRRSIVNYRYDDPEKMFDSHTYPKGGRVLHMLRFELGDDAFWRAIRRYVEVNHFRTVETADLRIAVEETSGQGMGWFFDQWLHHGGHPEFEVSWNYDEATKDVRLTVKQTQKVDQLTPLFKTSAEIEIVLAGETQMKRILLSKGEETFHFAAASRPSRVCFDPRDWILKKLKFEKSKEEWINQLQDDHLVARLQAVKGLSELKDDAAAKAALLVSLAKDSHEAIRREAAISLGKFAGDDVKGGLLVAAKEDKLSKVRTAAISSLGNFSADDVRLALRERIASDSSYQAVAAAVRTLVKVDADKCGEALLAALATPSHEEVVLRAVADSLVELKHPMAIEKLSAELAISTAADRKVILLGALARLQPTDPKALALVHDQVKHRRRSVRRAALDSLTLIAHPDSLAALEAMRKAEEVPGGLKALDDALNKLRTAKKNRDTLATQVETLQKKNDELEQRLKALETKESK